jgi:uncharacterized protein YndB with AHSA1/START domain
MKKEIEIRKAIDVPAARVWAVIRTGEDVDLWFSAITSCRREGDQRFCSMAGGGELSETITLTNEDHMTFGYRVDRHPLPVGPVEATMQVVDTGSGRSEIVWRAAFEGGEAEVAQVAGMLEGLYGQGIDSLAAFARKQAA